jgi:autotransporter translocation and assembly factor TamB
VSGENLRYGDFSLGGIESDFSYDDFRITLDLLAHNVGRQVLSANGSFPFDLRLERDSTGVADVPVDLEISADSFPAAIALAFLKSLEQVEGTVSGDVRIGGTAADLEPAGTLVLANASARLPDLGVRHRNVQANLVLTPDGDVEVDGSLRSEGTAEVTGSVSLSSSLLAVGLDLEIQARNFLAVNRRDVIGRLSGTAGIRGTYGRPRITGDLTVEQGEMMVEEVARSVEVLDLSDPAFFDVVDTTSVTLRPILRPTQNPFLQNLRLDSLTLTMARNSWLRGRQLNVEMAGTLDVFWDRTAQYLTFLGSLDAVRGTYSVFSRQFQVEEGTVSFPGVPGVNPDLNIRALNRLRTPENEQLEIIATVEGSLLAPRVSLSGNSAFPIGEDDLVSYLIFGQPAYAVGAGRSAFAEESAVALRGATANLAVGLFSSELGSILTRDTGLDYLAVTQGSYGNLDSEIRQWEGALFATQVEIGKYLTEDIFAALQWRPIRAEGSEVKPLAAIRIEVRLADNWTLEGYMEDRFLRNSMFLLGSGDLDSGYSRGFFLYRQWGY